MSLEFKLNKEVTTKKTGSVDIWCTIQNIDIRYFCSSWAYECFWKIHRWKTGSTSRKALCTPVTDAPYAIHPRRSDAKFRNTPIFFHRGNTATHISFRKQTIVGKGAQIHGFDRSSNSKRNYNDDEIMWRDAKIGAFIISLSYMFGAEKGGRYRKHAQKRRTWKQMTINKNWNVLKSDKIIIFTNYVSLYTCFLLRCATKTKL